MAYRQDCRKGRKSNERKFIDMERKQLIHIHPAFLAPSGKTRVDVMVRVKPFDADCSTHDFFAHNMLVESYRISGTGYKI